MLFLSLLIINDPASLLLLGFVNGSSRPKLATWLSDGTKILPEERLKAEFPVSKWTEDSSSEYVMRLLSSSSKFVALRIGLGPYFGDFYD